VPDVPDLVAQHADAGVMRGRTGTVLDHLVVVAPTLAAGADFVRSALGVEPQPGGAHPRMGTHNLLLPLGESTYLEIIAIDPAAPKPLHPRWFALDALGADSPPRLAAWVARSADVRAASARWTAVVGSVEPMTRGTLSWLITIRPDGGLPLGGAVPALIEWQVEPHPAARLTGAGCSLVDLEIAHPDPAHVRAVLASLGVEPPPRVVHGAGAQAFLAARIRTPHGVRTLAAA
jgi:hypothetical protein